MKKKEFAARRFISFGHLVFLSLIAAVLFLSVPAFALQQLLNTGFTGNANNWTIDNQIVRGFAMNTWDYDGGTGNPAGSFYGRFAPGGGTNRTADGIIQQSFTTPNGQVNATLNFDRLKFRTNSIDYFYLYGRILDSTSAAYPNETGTTVFTETITGTYAVPGTWENTGWSTSILLDANKSYIVRIYMDVRADTGSVTGAYLDNIRCNISPSGLVASPAGANNNLSWNASTGAVALHGATPYRIYRSATSGGAYALVGTSVTNSWTDTSPPAAAFYVITDMDTTGLESPYSTEAGVVQIAVRDGTGADIDSIVGSMVNLNWTDVVMAKLRYEVALGTTPGGTDIIGWTDAALATNYSFSGVLLTDGTTYYTSVRIVTAAGATNSSSSDGFVAYRLDVRDGTGADIDSSTVPDTIDMNWDSLVLPVSRYDVAIGTTPGGTDVVGWTNMAMATSATFTGLTLVNGTVYYCSVRPFDMGGVAIATVYSDGFQATIPLTITVRDGLGPDINYSFFENRAEMNWNHPATALIRYEVAVGTSKFSENIYPFTDVGHTNQAKLTGLTLASGTRYFATVRGINAFGEVGALGASDGFTARRDPVLVDTASQSYFHNARVLDMIDTTTDAASIRPRIFSSAGGATAYWRYRMAVSVTEPGVSSRINAPCRIIFAVPGGQMANVSEVRVADEAGNEIPRFNLGASLTALDVVFLVSMRQGETKNYWIYWGNTSATEPAYGFTNSATGVSANQWTPYYSRKDVDPGAEEPVLGATLSNADDATVTPAALPWPFYFFGTNTTAWRMNTNGFLSTLTLGSPADYSNRWANFTGATAGFGKVITPMWSDLWPGGGSPIPDGIFYNVYADRVVYTWRANRFGVRDDIYITQAVLYRSGDIALRYSYLSTLGIIGPAGTYDRPENTENTVGISNCNNTHWLTNTPLIIGIGKSPTAFYQCCDAFRGNYTTGGITGGALGTWVEIAHIESMVFDSRTANPLWQRIEYDCTGNANNRLVISTRSGPTPLPELGGWTAWVAAATVTANGNTALTSTNRYIQYRVGFERNNTAGALAVLNEIRFVHGGISIEEIRATTPDGISQGQNGIPVEVTIRNFYTAPVNLQSAQLTFTLGTYTQVITSPVLPTAIPAGGTSSVFFTVNVADNSPVGTATVDALATATAGAVTFYDGDAQWPHQWWVRSKANLVITQVETGPTHVNKGQSGVPVNMVIANLGETPYTFDGASLTFSLGIYSQTLQSPLPGFVVPALGSIIATFSVDINLTSPSGVAIIGGTASGTSTFSGKITEDAVASITDSWTIQNPAQLVLEEVIASSSVYRGQTNTPVLLRVSNPGEATAIWKSSDIISYFTLGTYDDVYPVSIFDIYLPGGLETVARYGVDISPTSATGTSVVDADISGVDANVGFPVGWTNALFPTQWTILGEKINTYKDPVFTLPSVSYNRPIAGTVSVYALAEDVLPLGEFVVRWINPSGIEAFTSSVLSSDASGTLAHELLLTPASPGGLWKVKVTNPVNTYTACENQFEVVSPAIIGSQFSMPARVSTGQPFVASLTFVNSGGAEIDSGYPSSLTMFGPGTANLAGGPSPAVLNVPGFSQATTTFSFVAQTTGNFSASATVYGFDANSGAFLTGAPVTSNICLIQSPPAMQTVSVTAVPTVVYRNQKNLSIVVNVRNNGQATAVLNAASLTFSLGTYDQLLVSPALPYSLAGGANVNFVYDIGVSATSLGGLSTFNSNVQWHDENWPASSSYLTGAAPNDSWTIQPVGINLSANLSYDPLQSDFNRLQTVYIRVFGVAPLSQWYRVRVYNTQIAQAANSPAGWINVSPQLSADDSGFVDHLYTLPAAAVIGTWSVVIDTGTNAAGGPMVGLQYFRVQNPGNLVASLSISPASVFVGATFTVTLTATNTVANGSTISNIMPGLLQTTGASAGTATLLSGPDPASFSLKANEGSSFSYTYRADSDTGLVGSFSLTVASLSYVAGEDLNTRAAVVSNNGVSNPLIIYGRKLQLASDTIDFGTLLCGVDAAVGNTMVQNIGNYTLDNVKWITTDLNGPGIQKISKVNLSLSPSPVNSVLPGAGVAASASLFVPYNQLAGSYIATMSLYNDRNSNEFFDIDEVYDLFNVKVTIPPCKQVFAVENYLDLGGWSIGQTTVTKNVNVFSGGNLPLDNLKFMQITGTNTFAINVLPLNPGAMAMNGSLVASVSANITVGPAGRYIATWTVWNDQANFGVIDAGEASDSFQVWVQVGAVSYTLLPSPVNAGTIEPSDVDSGFGLTLANTGGLPLKQLKTLFAPLSNGTGGSIASDGIALEFPIVMPVETGSSLPVTFALFVPAGTPSGNYSGIQYIYHDDNLNNSWDATEFRASFDLQAVVPLVPKVQVMVSTVGVGGIGAGTSKIVSFPCRNTGNVNLTQLRWEKTNLVSGANSILAAQVSFPPLEPFSIPAGQFFNHDIQVTVPGGQAFGSYLSSGGHYWLFEDLPVLNGVRNVAEPQSNFKVSCDVGELKLDVLEANLNVSGNPNSLTSAVLFNVKNIGTLQLARLKATGTALIPMVAGPINIEATASVFTPVSLGSALIGQTKQSQWAVNIPSNASAATYIGMLTVWEDSNNNNLIDTGEASDTAALQLLVNSKKMVLVNQEPMDLSWAAKNTVTTGVIEVRNVGNLPLASLDFISSPMLFGANNIPAASITLTPDPVGALAVGAAMTATVTVTIGSVQADGTYSGLQRIYDDYSAANSAWDAVEEFDTFELILRIGQKLVYETDPSNPPLDFGARNVNATYTIPLTLYNGTAVPLSRLRWKVLGPLTNGISIATLSFTPAGSTSIPGGGNRLYQASAGIGTFTTPGLYIATATFWDDDTNDNLVQATEASATFNVTLTVNPNYVLDIASSTYDFGKIAQGATATREIMFHNLSNVQLDAFAWTFLALNHVSEPESLASLSADPVVVPYPVPINAYATATVFLHAPQSAKLGMYGTGELQKLADTIAIGAEDDTSFTCEVIPGGPSVAPGSVYQLLATATFQDIAPDNRFFLSAWVSPGTGSAHIGYVEHDNLGNAVATFAIAVDAAGNITVDPLSGPIVYYGKVDSVPFTSAEYPGVEFTYYRVFLAFERTFNPAIAKDCLIILNNSSANAGQPVWFDGIMLEKAETDQTRPSVYHPTKTLRSPNRGLTIQGEYHYNEW